VTTYEWAVQYQAREDDKWRIVGLGPTTHAEALYTLYAWQRDLPFARLRLVCRPVADWEPACSPTNSPIHRSAEPAGNGEDRS
jgi:hypothetical protein